MYCQVRGVPSLKAFSANLMKAYSPPPPKQLGSTREQELQAEVEALRKRVAELEAQLASK